MKFTKPALSFEEQADLILSRGLVCKKDELIQVLKRVNYYRLNSYLFEFRIPGSENFTVGTNLETILERYSFDSELRMIVSLLVEKIEIALLRTQLVEQFTISHGPFCYANKDNFFPKDKKFHKKLMAHVKASIKYSNAKFIDRYFKNYKERHLPFWMLAEIMAFGHLEQIYKNMNRKDKIEFSAKFNTTPKVMDTWLRSIRIIRNTCAHQDRFWNKNLPAIPIIPSDKNIPEFHIPKKVSGVSVFGRLTTMKYLLNIIEPNSDWKDKLIELFNKYPNIPISEMGFPENWTNYPIWSS